MSENDLDDLEHWEPKTPEVNVESWKKHAFRADERAEKRLKMCIQARILTFDCPACGIPKNIAPTFTGDEWHYFGQCSHCGTTWANVRPLIRKCEECGKHIPLTSRNPEGKCKCEGEARRPF